MTQLEFVKVKNRYYGMENRLALVADLKTEAVRNHSTVERRLQWLLCSGRHA